MHRQIIFLLIQVFSSSMLAFAGPPQAILDPDSPGLFVPFSGDPDTTEQGCREQDKDNTGQFFDCSWDFAPRDYGKSGNFQQGDWRIDTSTTSNDGQAVCASREGFRSGFCGYPVMRYEVTTKQDPTRMVGMNVNRDWVFSVDYQRTYNFDPPPQDSGIPGGGDVFQLHIASELTNSRNYLNLIELPEVANRAYLIALVGNQDGEINRHAEVTASYEEDLFSEPTRLTVHYKADNGMLDFWVGDRLMAENFMSGNGVLEEGGGADLGWIQIGTSTRSSVIYQSFDNLIIGVLDEATNSLPGDANGDGVVDVADLGVVGANFGLIDVTFADGDFNGDNVVDVADLGILGANWTTGQAAGSLVDLVPEPATLPLLAMSVLMVGCRWR